VVESREDFAAALTALRTGAGLTVRNVVVRSQGPHGTISGWFAGQHAPLPANHGLFRAVLVACGVGDHAVDDWFAAAQRARRAGGARRLVGASPYRGLLAFEAADADCYFGRVDLVAMLREQVRLGVTGSGASVIAVVGASGSGKSSLLRAGLIPALDRWELLTPGAHPAGSLGHLSDSGPRVIIVDQCEELWTQCHNEHERSEFLTALQTLASRPATVIVVGLRADFFGVASGEEVLLPALQTAQIVVGPMGRDQVRSVIVEPAARMGVRVDDGLVDLLLSELAVSGSSSAHSPGALPLLSHALLGTWHHATRKRMTVADYFATGGIRGAIETTAERVYAALTPTERDLARRMMLRLVSIDDDMVTRRRIERRELSWGAAGDAEVTAVVERFTAERLLTVSDAGVEISHEALVGAWPRLKEWIESDQAGLLIHRRLTLAAHAWEGSDRDPGDLLGVGRLEVFSTWANTEDHYGELNTVERDFLDASAHHQQALQARERRSARTLRRFSGATALFAVVALALAAVAAVSQTSAKTQRVQAELARDEAVSRLVDLQAEQLRTRDPALAQQLALVSYRIAPTIQARSALLDSTAIPTPRRVPTVPGSIATSLSADGSLLAVANSDGKVRLIDRRHPDRAVTTTFPAASQHLFAVAFSPDRTRLAVGGEGGAQLWDVSDPTHPLSLSALPEVSATVYDLAWAPDGRELAAATSSGVARWAMTPNTSSPGAAIHTPLDAQGAPAHAVAYSPDGALIGTGGDSATVQLWARGPTVPRLVASVPMDAPREFVLALQFDPSSHSLAVGSRSKEALLLDVSDPARPTVRNRFGGFLSYVNSVAFSADGARLVAGSADNSTQVWDTRSGTRLQNLPGPAVVTSAVFADGDGTVIDTSVDGIVREWPLPGPVSASVDDTVVVLQASQDGHTAIAGTGAKDNSLRQFDLSDPTNVHERGPRLQPPAGATLSGAAAISRDGHLAAAGDTDGRAYVWDTTTPTAPRLVTPPLPTVHGIVAAEAFSPDGSWLAATSSDNSQVALIDLRTPSAAHVISNLDAGSLGQLLAVSPNGSLLAAATSANQVIVWDVSAGPSAPRLIARLGGFDATTQTVAFSPDSHTLAAGSADKTVRLWDMSNPAAPRDLARLTGPSGAIYSLTYNRAGTRLAAGTGDQGLWIWDMTNPTQPTRFAVLDAYPGRVNDVAFGPADRSLSAAGPDKTIRTWTTNPDQAAATICSNPASAITHEEWDQYLPGRNYSTPCP
jgi:WD40 repeat protein